MSELRSRRTDDCRECLRRRPNCQFVEREEYCALLISTRRMQRCNDRAAALFGLEDVSSGDHYFIEEEKLFELDTDDVTRAWSVLPEPARLQLAALSRQDQT